MANKRARLAGLLTSNPKIAEQVAVNNAVLGGLLGVGDEPSAMYPRAVQARRLSDLGGILSQAIPGETIAGLVAKGAAALKGAPLLGAVTAWHGSPHKFDRFDLSKIGTGEGAQAYGHGAYLAESPGVAEGYRKQLSGRIGAEYRMPSGEIYRVKNPDAAIGIDEVIKHPEQAGFWQQLRGDEVNDPASVEVSEFVKALKGGVPEKLPTKDLGSLYKTDIPDEAVARFLDWDKPLSEQAPEVQAAIKGMRDKFPMGSDGWDIRPWMDADPLASTWHNEAVRNLGIGQDFFTKHLLAGGVPGIRYLDSGSRATGGTSNFVIFDPDMIRILERNNVATGAQPWQPGEYQGLLSR